MSNEWQNLSLGEIVENKSRRFDFNNQEQVVFINTGDVLEGKFLHSNTSNVKGLPGQAKKAIKKGDLLYSEIRPINKRYALVDFESDKYVVSTKFMVLSLLRKDVNLKYLYTILTSNSFIKTLQHIAESRSGTFPQITFDAISYLPLSLPPLSEQKVIAHILGTLDDKIELNRRMNETLEQMAQALFKSWFVDFDPVLDNAIAAGKVIPDVLKEKAERRREVLKSGKYKALPKEVQELFPADFEYNEELEKWVPKGWEVKKLGDLIELQNGFAFKGKDFIEEGVPVIKIKNVKANRMLFGSLSYVSSELASSCSKFRIEEGDILITMTGNRYGGSPDTWVGKVAMFDKGGDYLLNQRVGRIRVSTSNVTNYYLNQMLSSNESQLKFILSATSSGGQANISPDSIKEFKVLLPPKSIMDIHKEHLRGIVSKINAHNKQNDSLTQQRDVLLPQLISGKLRVNFDVLKKKKIV